MAEGTPWELVEALTEWAHGQSWCEWLELGGSLGRGAGDELSDVDAGIGVTTGEPYASARAAALTAAVGFAPVADTLVQHLGSTESPADHLVVLPAEARTGLPPEARALLDRAGRLATPWYPASASATGDQRREWAFLAWFASAMSPNTRRVDRHGGHTHSSTRPANSSGACTPPGTVSPTPRSAWRTPECPHRADWRTPFPPRPIPRR
ncbi:hypothetical protein [Amycolatopsis antarctica]|uniref:hypothetical protein n=1 Tax=Amycolatopsis antarctica TaxID=1854586 RepID=UPI00105478B1|nr:hypothetical protein [Amycolatopsis antarctica]